MISQNDKADIRTVFVNQAFDRSRNHASGLVTAEGFHKRTLEQNLLRFSELVEMATKAIYSAKEKDDIRGKAIMPEYEIAHTLAHEDNFVIETIKKKNIRGDIDLLLSILKKH